MSSMDSRPSINNGLNVKALMALMLGVVIVTLDISLTSTAVPSIATSLGISAAKVIWIINAYYLAVIAALLPLAALGEIHGHRRLFMCGLLVFALGALASGAAQSLWSLVAGRALLGLGTAAVSATTPAMIRTLYPPARLGRGLGLYAMVVGIAFTVGPTATSAVLSVASWPWLFWMSAPFALIAFVLGMSNLPDTERSIRRFDPLAAALCSAMFACLLLAIAGMAHMGWRPVALAMMGAAMFYGLLRHREAGRTAPLLAADLFKVPLFALSAVTSSCAFAVQGLVFVVLPFLFIFKMGYTQVEAGLLITPWPAALAFMTLIAPRLAERIAPGLLGCAGLVILSFGLMLIAVMPVDMNITGIAWRLGVCGVGFGLFQSPNMVALMSSAPKDRSGSAGGILATSRLLGQSIGAASVAFCLSTWTGNGVVIAIWLGAALAMLGSGVSLLRLLPSVNQRSAEQM